MDLIDGWLKYNTIFQLICNDNGCAECWTWLFTMVPETYQPSDPVGQVIQKNNSNTMIDRKSYFNDFTYFQMTTKL